MTGLLVLDIFLMKRLFIFIFLIFLISCGNEAPTVSFPIYNVLIYQSGSLRMPSDSIFLSIYFILNDENGMEDIDTIKITHIDTEYSWEIPANLLSTVEWQDKTYYGYSFLEYDNGKSILTGDYSIEVTDKTQNFTNLVFTVDIDGAESNKPYNVPQIKYEFTYNEKNKEMKIVSDEYSSFEIKFIDNLALYNYGRKKFKLDENAIINVQNSQIGNQISVRVNKDINESLVYFIKDFNIVK